MFKAIKSINYKTTRAIQICIVFTTTLWVQELFGFAHAAWTGFAVMMIYVGFDAGSAMQRTFHRFFGALFGLLLSYILWFIGHIDYRLLFMIIPIIVFMAYFSLGKLYTFPTIFTVTLTALGTDYYSNNTYYVAWFFSDYFICTVLALAICVFFEYFIFKNSNLTHKFYYDLQKDIILDLITLLQVVNSQPLSQSKFLKRTVEFNQKVLDFNNFVATTDHDYRKGDNLLAELNQFSSDLKFAYHNIRKLYVLGIAKNAPLVQEVQTLIRQMEELSKKQQDEILFRRAY